MTESEKKSAQTAEKNTKPEEEGPPVDLGPQTVDALLEEFNPKDLERAQKLGFPIKSLLNYMRLQEAKINAIANAIPNQEEFKSIMNEAVRKVMTQQFNAMRQAPPTAGGGRVGMNEMMMFGQMLGMGGGGGDPEINKITKDILKENLASMKQRAALTDAFMNTIISNIASRTATKIVDKAI